MRNPFVKKTSDGKWVVSVCEPRTLGFHVWYVWAKFATWREAFDEARCVAQDRMLGA